jgi:ABC-type Zn uptake system ZnuABC Zn-binding protein ZnuA
VSVLAVGACSIGPGSDGLRVVTTVAPVTDLVQRVVGGRASVVGLIPEGENAHTYQPRPSEARALAEADVFFDNGLGLNDLVEFAANDHLPDGAKRIELAAVAVPESEYVENPALCHFDHCHSSTWNPHLWTDPVHARAYVEQVNETMAEVDGGGKAAYDANRTALVAQLEALDAAIREAVATIPEADRKLVVYHDAWDYFGRRYGFELIGVIQPVDFSEPSAAEVRAMIEQIRTEKVRAFFGSEVFPTSVLDVVAEETGATYVRELADDRMPGPPDAPEHSYVGMMVTNAKAIVTALGGDPAALDSVPLTAPPR